jgi:hypothetical protein
MARSNQRASGNLIDHAVTQHADIFGFHFDDIAGF